jgi:ATP-dependent phosphofructokinase / diphosphate-dependent phosphofructokinase
VVKTIAIGQGGGPTPVINDQLAGALYEAKNAGLRVIGLTNGLEGLMNAHAGNIIDINGWNPEVIRQSPGAVLHTTRMKIKRGQHDEIISQLKDNLERYGIGSIAYFGGNDSSYILQQLGVGVHGSKTIDNDLVGAHHTPGFGSAALFNATAIKNLAPDTGAFRVIDNQDGSRSGYKTAPLVVYQTMGRDTGWLALAAGFSMVNPDGQINEKMPPDVIWPREVPYDESRFLDALSNVLERKGKAFVVIGEELVDLNGAPLSEKFGWSNNPDSHGHEQHARSQSFDYADFIARTAKDNLNVRNVGEIKETPLRPKHLQRVYVKSSVDAQEAYEVGREAVRAILDGDEQKSIVLQKLDGGITPVRVAIGSNAGLTRRVPLEYINDIKGPTQEFVDELLPAIGGAKVLPHYAKLDFSRKARPLF